MRFYDDEKNFKVLRLSAERTGFFLGTLVKGTSQVTTATVACIGLNTDIKKLIRLGLKPFVCGLIAALAVGAVSFTLVTIFGNFLQF